MESSLLAHASKHSTRPQSLTTTTLMADSRPSTTRVTASTPSPRTTTTCLPSRQECSRARSKKSSCPGLSRPHSSNRASRIVSRLSLKLATLAKSDTSRRLWMPKSSKESARKCPYSTVQVKLRSTNSRPKSYLISRSQILSPKRAVLDLVNILHKTINIPIHSMAKVCVAHLVKLLDYQPRQASTIALWLSSVSRTGSPASRVPVQITKNHVSHSHLLF